MEPRLYNLCIYPEKVLASVTRQKNKIYKQNFTRLKKKKKNKEQVGISDYGKTVQRSERFSSSSNEKKKKKKSLAAGEEDRIESSLPGQL